MPFTLSESAFLALVDTYVKRYHNSNVGALKYTRRGSVYYNPSGQKIFEISKYKEKNTSFSLLVRQESIKEIIDIFETINSQYPWVSFTVQILTVKVSKVDYSI